MKHALTLTVIANITSNYGEGLGNVSSIQKVFKNGNTYATRSRESLKNSLMVQSGMYDDLKVTVDGATQKEVNEKLNVSNCRALEGGYMNTSVGEKKLTFVRKSSFYLTDAIACDPFVNETRFHNNLHLARTYAKANNITLQDKEAAKKTGLMPYNYEYDKSLKMYSITFDLSMIGKDENFDIEASREEKAERVNSMLKTIENLNLIVKGNLDNAEPVFVVGGLSDRMTHQFENVVRVKNGKLKITNDLKDRIARGYKVGLLEGGSMDNEADIVEELKPVSIAKFFDGLKDEVNKYYGI
ncbi:type I-B CRISPR-associated protein Cas7/Cst2/DevR [Psychrilyobacter piezotolerans]|uniref:Type I-B CRISPR-associated protein Cas7/Cst2/DevR n=2 Tax=Fusobacteriaceae TaxID=203492 RepID=A0ABX9KFR1_9FUSO|nr:type I-B CRISPR-associated protein Cas7/Cst2/DevR [Psychrilyobacter piezotolerans]NDI78769.1 type I-B CRISPR-associated protein Cas7/Cst2/DevR [Psychrilyobacter piezotolerans]RDE60870.1 type I-B CRISPR-associated protein Cas7/Cst2/DevR [Psychrilyobacter sp. S5]REI40659.1 type I-B CRISPR-associated protein Cas7/Cst2/DevR [Psychrilyobacter piezotolerans]